MNIVQQILVAILKSMCIVPFQPSLTKEEKVFIKYLLSFQYFRNLHLQTTLDGKAVLTWESKIGRMVGCPVTDRGFFFSQVEVYNEKERSMRCNVEYNFPGDSKKVKLVETEIEEIKNLFMTFSIDAEVYFK